MSKNYRDIEIENENLKQRIRVLEASLDKINSDNVVKSNELRSANQQLKAANDQLVTETEKLKKVEEEQRQYAEDLELSQRASLNLMEDAIEKSQKLTESERKFRLMTENSIDCVWHMDLRLNFTYISPSVFNMFGFTPEEWMGTNLASHATRREFFKMARVALKGIKTYKTFKHITFEANMLHKDGRTVAVEINGKLIKNAKGLPVGLQGATRDVTSRKEAQRELLKSEKKFRTLVNTLPDYIWLKDIDGVYLSANPMFEEFFGKKESEIVGKTDYDFVPKELADQFRENDLKAIEAEYPRMNEEEIIRAVDSRRVLLETTKTPMHDDEGKIIGVLGIGHDITERKDSEDKIRTNLREKETLIRELYHRTKNNMQVIISMLSIQGRTTDNKIIKEVIEEIKNKVMSMALVHQKLYQSNDLSRINLKDYVKDLTRQLAQSLANKKKDTHLNFDLDDVYCLIDTAIPLGLIINELITNSYKYAWNRVNLGTLKICLKKIEEHSFFLSIADDGVGLPDDFDLDKDKNLGLETVILLCKGQLGGDISYNSDAGLEWQIHFRDDLYSERV